MVWQAALAKGVTSVGASLATKGLDRLIFGSPGKQAGEYMNDAFPGTSPWERLSSPASSVGGKLSGDAQAAATARYVAQTQAKAQVDSAKEAAKGAVDAAKASAGAPFGVGAVHELKQGIPASAHGRPAVAGNSGSVGRSLQEFHRQRTLRTTHEANTAGSESRIRRAIANFAPQQAHADLIAKLAVSPNGLAVNALIEAGLGRGLALQTVVGLNALESVVNKVLAFMGIKVAGNAIQRAGNKIILNPQVRDALGRMPANTHKFQPTFPGMN